MELGGERLEKVGKGWKRLGRFPRAGCGTADPEVSPRDKNRNKNRDKDRDNQSSPRVKAARPCPC